MERVDLLVRNQRRPSVPELVKVLERLGPGGGSSKSV